MELYLSILKIFLTNKEAYQKYKDFVDKDYLRQNFPEILRVFLVFEKLWDTVSAKEASKADLEAVFYTNYPKADKAVFEPLFAKIWAVQADPKSIESFLDSVMQRQVAASLAFTALDFAEGKIEKEAFFDTLKASSGTFDKPETGEKSEDDFVSDDIELLYNKAVKEGGLNWRLRSLRRSLGPLRKGDFGFVFARPETGKTTFLASEVSYMAVQATGNVLWFNNEEQGEKVGMRLYEAVLAAPLERIASDFKRAREAYVKRVDRRIKIRDDSGIGRRSIEKLCQLYEPALIVVDQLDKVRGFDADREDLLLGAIYQWARELAKRFAPVIGVSQADGTAEGVKWLNMGHVANAKTAKQAEADWILGIGQDWNDPPNVRGFTICKNKLVGGEETVPNKRHGRFEALIEADIARYRDVSEALGEA